MPFYHGIDPQTGDGQRTITRLQALRAQSQCSRISIASSTPGPSWKHLVTDTTAGRPGNNERVAFVFDTRKVTFGGVAGEVVLPPRRVKRDGKTVYEPATQIWRTPGICGFHAGWTRFLLATVHITWGESQKAPPARVKEIEAIAKFLYKRSLDEDA
ncbi:MAG: hypothetical protein KAI47_06785 [Deltaproteobacteria bacterium]|nr:hypothetical protein [Deltaproteobacteria bacterium]